MKIFSEGDSKNYDSSTKSDNVVKISILSLDVVVQVLFLWWICVDIYQFDYCYAYKI